MLKKIKQKIFELGHLTPMAIVSALLPIMGSSLLIVFLIPIAHWIRANWEVGTALYLVGVLLFCGLALLPTNVVGLMGGWTFGFGIGFAILISGIIGASIISFLINSRLSGNRLPDTLRRHPRTAAIYRALIGESLKKTILIVTFMRMSVVMPFAFTNFLLAAARVPLPAFIVGTAVGMAPRSASMVFIGSGLAELDLENAGDFYVFAIGAVASVVSIAAIALISRKALEKMTATPSPDDPEPALD